MDGSGQSVTRDIDPSEGVLMAARAHQGWSPPGERMHDAQAGGPGDRPRGWGREFTELTLLLSSRQLEALEREASIRGMTTGQLFRRLIRDCLARLDDVLRPEEAAPPDAEAEACNADFPRGYAGNEH